LLRDADFKAFGFFTGAARLSPLEALDAGAVRTVSADLPGANRLIWVAFDLAEEESFRVEAAARVDGSLFKRIGSRCGLRVARGADCSILRPWVRIGKESGRLDPLRVTMALKGPREALYEGCKDA
jgi:hypothetical protein